MDVVLVVESVLVGWCVWCMVYVLLMVGGK
jgi:hypothetical protein